MRVVCGLGNPGPKYDGTRHNVGWWVLDRLAFEWDSGPFERAGEALAARVRRAGGEVLLLKPLTYVNRSGAALAPLVRAGAIDPARDLLLVVDDTALDVGRLRLRAAGGSGGHNGLKSVEAALGTQQYARLRIGIGAPPPDTDMKEWVLTAPEPEEEERIIALLPDAAAAVEEWIDHGIEAAMSRFNR